MTGMAGIKDTSPVEVLFAVCNRSVEAVTSDSRTPFLCGSIEFMETKLR